MCGVEYSKTHNIEQLIQLANSYNVDLSITDYIYDKAEMFSSWEAKTRYIKNYKLEKKKVSTAVIEVQKYIDNLIKQKDILLENNNVEEDYDNFDK